MPRTRASGGTRRDAALEDGAVAQRQPLLGDDASEATALATGGDDDIDDHEAHSMRVVRYTAMRSAVRPIVAIVVLAMLLGAALFTLRALGAVDPRGRASWVGTAPAFDATPRDVVLFLPACDVRAVVLHPSTPSPGQVEAEFFVAEPDGSARRAGAVSATAQPGTPIALPLGDVRPPWRAPTGGPVATSRRHPHARRAAALHPRPVARHALRHPRLRVRRGEPRPDGPPPHRHPPGDARQRGGRHGVACPRPRRAGRRDWTSWGRAAGHARGWCHGRHVPAGGTALRAARRTGALPVREVRRDHGNAAERRAGARLGVAHFVVRIRAAAAVLHRRRGRPEGGRTGRSRARPHVEPAIADCDLAAPSRRSSTMARRRRRPRGIGDCCCCVCARC